MPTAMPDSSAIAADSGQRVPSDAARCGADFVPQMIPPKPAIGFVEALVRGCDVSESSSGRGAGLVWAQPFIDEPRGLKLKVRPDLTREVVLRTSSPGHGISSLVDIRPEAYGCSARMSIWKRTALPPDNP
jgi:hypothetical protein